jgi:hypothetical protein
MRIALKQDPDGAQDRSIIVNNENASHGVLVRLPQPKVTYLLTRLKARGSCKRIFTQ